MILSSVVKLMHRSSLHIWSFLYTQPVMFFFYNTIIMSTFILTLDTILEFCEKKSKYTLIFYTYASYSICTCDCIILDAVMKVNKPYKLSCKWPYLFTKVCRIVCVVSFIHSKIPIPSVTMLHRDYIVTGQGQRSHSCYLLATRWLHCQWQLSHHATSS